MEKDYGQVCYTAGCNNYASVALNIPLGSRIRCVIHVCNGCLPKYELDDSEETYLANAMEKGRPNSVVAAARIPTYRSWIVKIWHFGVDTIDGYTGKEFEVTFQEGMSDLYRIYTKRMKDGKNIVRVEHQEYPNQAFADAAIRKLSPDGRLVVPGVGSDNAKKQ